MSLPFAESDGFALLRERKKLKMDSRFRGNDDREDSVRLGLVRHWGAKAKNGFPLARE